MKLVRPLSSSCFRGCFAILIWSRIARSAAVDKSQNTKNVYVTPSVTIDPGGGDDISLSEGDDIILRCLAIGHPKPKIKWTITGGDLDKRPLDLSNPELNITKLQNNEAGRITCKAENGIGGPQFVTIRLNVFYLTKPNLRLYKSKGSPVATNSMWYENTIVIRCETRSNPESVVSWHKDGRLIRPRLASVDRIETRKLTRYSKEVAVHLLKIFSATAKHYGNYECRSSLGAIGVRYNISDTKSNFTFSAKTAEPVITVMTQDRVVLNAGQALSLDCRVISGNPPPDVAWIHGNDVYSNRMYLSNKKVLLIPEVQESDAGSYFCVAENYVGNPVKKMVSVIVRYIKLMTYWITPDSLSDERRLELQRDIKLTCHTDAQPPEELVYSWFKKSGDSNVELRGGNIPDNVFISDLKDPEIRRFMTFPAHSSRLEIQRARLINYGTYACRARLKNGINGTEEEATIVITQDSAPSEVFAENEKVTVIEGTGAILACKSKGRPAPTLKWVRDGNVTIDDERIRIRNGNLIIRNVSRDDEDTYTCIPARENGFSKLAKTNKYAVVNLEVEYPPDVLPSYAVVRLRLQSQLSLSCSVMSAKPDKPWTFTWNKNGRTVSQTSGEQMNRFPLGRENYGLYECVVTNDAGSSSCLINVTGAAYAPEFYYRQDDSSMSSATLPNDAASKNSSESFTYMLSWTQRHPQAVDRVSEYRIRWRKNTADNQNIAFDWNEEIKTITGSIEVGELITHKIQNLDDGEYEVEVTPKTLFGYGDSAKRKIRARPKRGPPTTLQGYFFCRFSNPDICGFMQEPSGIYESINGVVQNKGDDFDWTFNSKSTQIRRTPNTGPNADHTTSDKDGGYMYIESSNADKDNRARLVSPLVRDDTSPSQCLRFFYHMWGRHIGRLNVILRSGKERIIWSTEGPQGNRWVPAMISFSSIASYQIIFEAVVLERRNMNYLGDMAIDDVMLENGPCPSPPTPSAKPLKNKTTGNAGFVPTSTFFLYKQSLSRWLPGEISLGRFLSGIFTSYLILWLHRGMHCFLDFR